MWLEKLKIIKGLSGKTLEEISTESGVPLGTLNKLFGGQTKNPKLETIKSVVHCLGFTIDSLVENDLHNLGSNKDLSNDEKLLIKKYRFLNEKGVSKLCDYINDLLNNQSNLLSTTKESCNDKCQSQLTNMEQISAKAENLKKVMDATVVSKK